MYKQATISDRVLAYITELCRSGEIYLYPELNDFVEEYSKFHKKEFPGHKYTYKETIRIFLNYFGQYTTVLVNFYKKQHQTQHPKLF